MPDDLEDTFEAALKPTPEDEIKQFADPELETKQLLLRSGHQDVDERLRYAEHAYGITQAWVGFLIVITMAQMSLKPLRLGLTEAEFIAVFTTTTASILGFWLLVGRYLPSRGPST